MGTCHRRGGLLKFYFCGEGSHHLPGNQGPSKLRTLPGATWCKSQRKLCDYPLQRNRVRLYGILHQALRNNLI